MSSTHHLVIGEVTLVPCGEWSPNVSSWALFRVASGLGYFLSAGMTRELSQGEAVSVPRGVKGMFRASRLSCLKLMLFQVHVESLSGLLSPSEGYLIEELLSHSVDGLRFLASNHSIATEFGKICQTEESQSSLAARFRLLNLFVDMMGSIVGIRMTPQVGTVNASARFDKVMREISESQLAECSLPDLARKCGCSERHFSRLFRNYFGVSVRTKQAALRLAKAGHLLETSGAKVIQVALDCGYRHLGLFNAMFKKRFGMTPTQWRTEAEKRHRPSRPALVRSLPSSLQ